MATPKLRHYVLDSDDSKWCVTDQEWDRLPSYQPTFDDWIIIDEKTKLIYIFDIYNDKNIRVLKMKDNNEFESLNDEILIPEDVRGGLCESIAARFLIHIYDSVVISFPTSSYWSDIWCLDLKNKRWFKSKYKIPYMHQCTLVNGMDNFVYFLDYKKSEVAVNFKISLSDIIPSEMYEINKENNTILINGYMNDIAKDTDYICPDSLMNLVLLYYPSLWYV